MNRNSQRILIFGGIAMAVIIIALLAIIAVLLMGGDDGESDTEAALITQTATRSPTASPTPRPTRTATAPSSSHSPEPQQPTAVATIVQQEPPPGTPQQTAAPPGQQPASTPPPTAPPAATPECPGPPTVAFFTANPPSITAGQSSTLDWGAVTNAGSVIIDQGIGDVQAPGGRVVSPSVTTIYTLTATGCGGTIERQATVIVNPPPPSPTPPPTPTEQPPPPGGGSWGIHPTDLALTGLNPDNLPQGEVWVTIANNGPYGLANTEAKLGCSGTAYYAGGLGSLGISTVPWSIYVSLEPGWSQQFDTTISVDTTLFSNYFLQCSIEAVGFKDDHPENDAISAWIP